MNVLAEEAFQAIEPLNPRVCMRLRGLGKMVDQNIASWNQALLWLRRVNTLRGGQAPTG